MYTTSGDNNMHILDCESAMTLQAPMEDMECDTLTMTGNKVIMRCGGGEAILVFKYIEGNEELEDNGMYNLKDSHEDHEEGAPINF